MVAGDREALFAVSMQVGFARIEANVVAQIERSTSDLMQWSFVFWVGAVAAIAALAGVLRG